MLRIFVYMCVCLKKENIENDASSHLENHIQQDYN